MSPKSKSSTEPQKQSEPIRKEIRGIIFLLIVIILGVSLFSYHPGDLVYGLKTGQMVKAHNLFGTVGAHLSGWIFHILGFSSFWLVVFFLVLAFLSFRGDTFLSPIKNIITTLFLIVSFWNRESPIPRGGHISGGRSQERGSRRILYLRFFEGISQLLWGRCVALGNLYHLTHGLYPLVVWLALF